MRQLLLLYRHLARGSRKRLFLTLILMILAGAAEMLTIGAVIPFLALAAGGAGEGAPGRLASLMDAFGNLEVTGAALFLITIAIIAAVIRLLLARQTQSFAIHAGQELAAAAFSVSLRRPLAEQVQRNSSRTIAAIEHVQPVVNTVVIPVLQAVVAAGIALCITSFLFVIDPFAASVTLAVALSIYVAVSLVTRPSLKRNAGTVANASAERAQIIQETLGGIRDVMLDRSMEAVEQRFRSVDRRFRRAQSVISLMSNAPRFVVDAAAVAVLAIVTLVVSQRPGGIIGAIPVLGALAVGGQRLLPLVQLMYQSWAQAMGNFQVLRELTESLSAAVSRPPCVARPGPEPLRFERAIEFDAVSYRHAGGRLALKDACFEVERGEWVGITGRTGGGKSTLLDLLTGLIEPDEGEIRIDGRRLDAITIPRWQAAISYVPQSVFLSDDSIAANISFPRPMDAVAPRDLELAIEVAQLREFLGSVPGGLDAIVGERGVRLSGGQRQRIGLARALVRRRKLLILDEATSALDENTEAAIIDALHRIGGLTLILVTHSPVALSRCNRVLRIGRGQVTQLLSPSDQNFA